MRNMAMVIGTIIMRGMTPIGGMTITPDGSGTIIRIGSSVTAIGAIATAIGTTIMCGATAIGGTKTIRTGSANIITIGYDGMTTTDEG